MRLQTVLAAVLFSASAVANEHKDNGPYYAFYHLQVANPAALVESMDRFWASDCGKQYPADVALSQEVQRGIQLYTLYYQHVPKFYGSSESSGNNAIVF